jgi:hypothetical protein
MPGSRTRETRPNGRTNALHAKLVLWLIWSPAKKKMPLALLGILVVLAALATHSSMPVRTAGPDSCRR